MRTTEKLKSNQDVCPATPCRPRRTGNLGCFAKLALPLAAALVGACSAQDEREDDYGYEEFEDDAELELEAEDFEFAQAVEDEEAQKIDDENPSNLLHEPEQEPVERAASHLCSNTSSVAVPYGPPALAYPLIHWCYIGQYSYIGNPNTGSCSYQGRNVDRNCRL